jgi:hypothetical protein
VLGAGWRAEALLRPGHVPRNGELTESSATAPLAGGQQAGLPGALVAICLALACGA